MALVINDRVRETTTTTGTGAMTFAGAVDGFETFSAGIGNNNTTYYAISLNSAQEFEVGLGTLNASSTTLTRSTVISSSNSDAAVDFSAGSKEIFCTLPASKTIYLDGSGDMVGSGIIANANIDASAAIAHSKMAALTINRAMITSGSGFSSASAVTATELGYVSGVSSAIQTQLDAKASNGFATAMAIAL